MTESYDNLVWITGATSGIGEALARTCPWPRTRLISVSRRQHPDHETVLFDLTDPDSWTAVGDHLTDELARFRGTRALFVHNALHYWGSRAFVGQGIIDDHTTEITANVVAPLVLGDLFLRACEPAVDAGVDVGLVQISSAAARFAYPGLAIYGAAKASVEQWVRAVRKEREHLGKGPWVSAVRPGFVNTPATRRDAELDAETYPGQPGVAEAVRNGDFLEADESAELIWGALPDEARAKAVLWFGEAVGITD